MIKYLMMIAVCVMVIMKIWTAAANVLEVQNWIVLAIAMGLPWKIVPESVMVIQPLITAVIATLIQPMTVYRIVPEYGEEAHMKTIAVLVMITR